MFVYKYVYMEENKGDDGAGNKGAGGKVDKTYTAAEFKAIQDQVTASQDQITAMQAKNDELLGEVKKNKNQRREAEDATRAAANAKAQKDGDFEQLFKSSEEVSAGLRTELDGLKSSNAVAKCRNIATSIANQLCEGDNVDLMSSFIAPRLKYTDEGVKVLDSKGQLTVSTVEDLTTEFQNNKRYASLLKGNQSDGGGAPGGKRGGATDKTLSRTDFDGLSSTKKMEFSNNGGRVID